MNVKSLIRCGLFSALIAVTAWISIPFPIPFTMQTFGIFLALLVLGGKDGTISVAVYILLGLTGLPVFSGFRGGFGIILSPLGGFVFGFFILGLIYFLITRKFGNTLAVQIAALSAGLISCYLSGSFWYIIFSNGISLSEAFTACAVPFILPDVLKLGLAFIIAGKINAARIFADKKTT